MQKMKLNPTQLAALRSALSSAVGRCPCDGSTGQALIKRGYATEGIWFHDGRQDRAFYLTDAGRARAQRKADVLVKRDGMPDDPSLMQDLPDRGTGASPVSPQSVSSVKCVASPPEP